MIIKQSTVDGTVISKKQSEKVIHLFAGIDVGSTQTRVSIADEHDIDDYGQLNPSMNIIERLCTSYIIPSTAAILENDNREFTPAGDELHYNYDSQITVLNNTAERPMFSKVRLLRGKKIEDAKGISTTYFDSLTDKVNNRLFYVNIIDALGYAILQKYNNVGIPKTVNIDLCVSVRPTELGSVNTKKMKDNLIGKFLFQWCGLETYIYINNLGFTTEPEAQISGVNNIYEALSNYDTEYARERVAIREKLDNCKIHMHIEGGGSSIGVELVADKKLINSFSTTFQLGGNRLAQIIAHRVREEKNIRASLNNIQNSVKTCMIQSGRSSIDISGIVGACKAELAFDIVEHLKRDVMELQNDYNFIDIEMITLGGRLFAEDDSGMSVAKFFTEYMAENSKDTEIVVLPDNFIPQGNMLIAIQEFMDIGEEDYEDDSTYEQDAI